MKKIRSTKPNIGQILIDALLFSRDIDENGCWNWTGFKRRGYGSISIQGKNKPVHRVAYELWVEPIPEGMWVCHKCDNPSCFNPQHLFIGTPNDNMQDCIRKGRMNKPRGEDHGNCKLTISQVLEIRKLASEGMTHPTIADMFCIGRSGVGRIVRREIWKHI